MKTFILVIYACQPASGPALPAQTHVWAVWSKMDGAKTVEKIVISWGPAYNRPGTVPGYHRTHEESLAYSGRAATVRCWKLKTDEACFLAAKAQRDRLRLYRMIDTRTRSRGAVNCEHAVSDVAGFLDTGTLRGIPAGQAVADHFVRQGKARP
jgi:hypothetical protein